MHKRQIKTKEKKKPICSAVWWKWEAGVEAELQDITPKKPGQSHWYNDHQHDSQAALHRNTDTEPPWTRLDERDLHMIGGK